MVAAVLSAGALVGACSREGVGVEEDGTSDIDPGPAEDVPLGGDDPTLSDDEVDVGGDDDEVDVGGDDSVDDDGAEVDGED